MRWLATSRENSNGYSSDARRGQARLMSHADSTIELTQDEAARLIADRRDFHRHPELLYNEHRTAGIVAERLAQYGYRVQTGIGRTGVVGCLVAQAASLRAPNAAATSHEQAATLLYRADMD